MIGRAASVIHLVSVCLRDGTVACLEISMEMESPFPVCGPWVAAEPSVEPRVCPASPRPAGMAACSPLSELSSVSVLGATPEVRGKGFISVAEALHSRLRDPK